MAPSNLALELERIGIDPGQYPLATGAQTVGSAPQLGLGTQALGTPTPISAPPPAGPTTAQRIGGAVGAIGDVLQNTAAGFYGRGMTTPQIQAQQQLAGQAQLQNLSAKLGLVSQVGQMIDQVPEDQREELRARMIEQVGQHAPEFVDFLSTDTLSGISRNTAELMEHWPELRAIWDATRDPKAVAQKIVTDREGARLALLRKDIPEAKAMFRAAIEEYRKKNPERYEQLVKDGLSFSEGREIAPTLSTGDRGTRPSGRAFEVWEAFPEAFLDMGFLDPSETRKVELERAKVRAREEVKAEFAGPARSRGLRQVDLPDGRSVAVFEMSDGTLRDQFGNRFIVPEGSVVRGLGEKKQPRGVAEIRQTLGETGEALSDMAMLRGMLKPGLLGIRGPLAEKAGGYAGQIFGEEAGETTAKYISGFGLGEEAAASQEEITRFRQLARAISTAMIADFTGEQTGRISEAERQIALEAARLIASSSNVTQVDAALRSLMKIKLKKDMTIRLQAGQKPFFDFQTDEGVTEALGFFQEQLGIEFGESQMWAAELLNAQRITKSVLGLR